MSELKYCQGPDCHTYTTQDRLKGPKGNKTNQTRRRSSLLWGEFCDTRCQYAWFDKYGTKAVDHFGRLNEVKHLTKENAWVKDYDWRIDDRQNRYFFVNKITQERRQLTEEQYEDRNYTLNSS
tara:strand:- start:424 stop:792 length:369 start_codon:yes stop_codon:yes gene_type:complete